MDFFWVFGCLVLVLEALVELLTNCMPLSEGALTCRVDNFQSSCVRLVCRQLRLWHCEIPTLVMRNPSHPCRLSCRERAIGAEEEQSEKASGSAYEESEKNESVQIPKSAKSKKIRKSKSPKKVVVAKRTKSNSPNN